MKNKLGQESAFVQPFCMDKEGNFYTPRERSIEDSGMSKRFYAACAAMQGLLANPYLMESLANDAKSTQEAQLRIIKASYQYADELLKQENNE